MRDIVSGIFYLSDDAFRVGEYIDCGKAKGTVEGFTLRSIKLRHQNGQVHTIPFGQLGQITNFSRDWITVKFNLRFARDTDLEKLRKAAKKIGADMMEMPADQGRHPGAVQDAGRGRHRRQRPAGALQVHRAARQSGHDPARGGEAHVQRLPGLGHRIRQGRAAVVVHAAPAAPAEVAPAPAAETKETPALAAAS